MNKRLFLCYLIITLILIASLEGYLALFAKDYYISRLKEELLTQADLVKDLLPADRKDLDAFLKRYRERTGARITVISYNGQVLGNSDKPSSMMENHLDRPEIKEAMLSGKGSALRYSSTLKEDFIYIALLVEGPTEKSFLRLSMPLKRIKADIQKIRIPIVVTTLLIFITVSLIWIYQTGRLRKDIREIIEFSDRVASGDLRSRLFINDESELSRLGNHIVYMAEELRARLEEAKREKQTMETVLKNMKEGLLIVDRENRVVLLNDALIKMLDVRLTSETITVAEILRDAMLLSVIEESRSKDEVVSREIPFRELYLSVTALPVPLSEFDRGTLITFHDITRLKRLEQIRKDFVANVAHEIRTPITAIKGFAETLLDGAIDDRESASRFLQIIKRHSERLNSLVNDLLTLSAIEQGEIKMEITEINLSEVIDSVLALMEEKARSKGLYLKKALPEDTLPIMADRDRLLQILLNLVDNGIKFTDSGGVTVEVQRDGDKLIISVRDTGCGIEKRHLPRLGERFYRVDRARSRELGGTGLGLAIVKHLVMAHGWDMQIDSTPGKGTAVKILVPFVTKS